MKMTGGVRVRIFEAGFGFASAAIVAICGSMLMGAAHAEPVTFSKDVAPIFFQHCVMCHRPGQVAPMSLLTYDEARPWGKAIAREVNLRNMPPWSGESDRHTWANDISLSDEEVDLIVKWVEQGTRPGKPSDMPESPTFSEKWTIGEPDLIITLDEIVVPAEGEDIFPQQSVTLDLDEPRWVRAIEFLPGDRRVAHHIQSTYNSPKTAGKQLGSSAAGGIGVLAVWTAGMPPYVFPEGMGRVLNPGTRILVDSHYHPYGEATTDQTQIGIYFGEGELQKEVATLPVANTGMRIPPGAAAHEEMAFYDFDRDMQVLAFSPHMHLRGKSMRYDLIYPDGRKETLLDVPKYNFNWQWLYYPTEPIDVPAGSRVEVTAVWDNSADNPANPDPKQEIIYRGNTFNEMFVGFMEVVPKEGVYHQPTPAREKLTSLLQGHEGDHTYLVGGFLPFGIYAPEEGEGWIYLSQGMLVFTITLDDFEWDGDTLTIRTQFPTPEASAATTTIVAKLDSEGRLKGTLEYAVNPDQPLKVPFVGQPIGPASTGP